MELATIAQIIGYVALAESLFIFISVKRSRIILLKLISDVLWAVNYAMLGAYTGAFLNGMAVARETVFYFKGKKKWATHLFWVFVFIGISMLSPVLDWIKGDIFWMLPLCPAIGTSLAVVSLYQKKPLHTKILMLFAQLGYIIYNIFVKNYPSLISGFITVLSIIIGIIRERTVREAKV